MASPDISSIPTPPPEHGAPSTSTPSSANAKEHPSFDIVSYYNHLLQTDSLLTQPIAAIISLISLLSASPPSTISETLSLIASSTDTLKSSVSNPIPLSAGTDLFQRYIISTLQTGANLEINGKRKKRSSSEGMEDFMAIRAHLLANSELFVQRAKEARTRIAEVARKLVRDGSTVLTCGRSRVVAAVLNAAAERGTDFRVIFAQDAHPSNHSAKTTDIIKNLRQRDIPIATIPFAALATALPSVTFAMVGAESIVANGGAILGIGTQQMGMLMQTAKKPFYIVAESHKFVRIYPLDGEDLPISQKVLDFRIDEAEDRSEAKVEHEEGRRKGEVDGVEFTPPGLITAIVTENGVQTPSAVSEELIKIWY